MTPTKDQIEAFLLREGVTFAHHTGGAQEEISKRWFKSYAQNVKAATGAWVHGRFRWHGFSFGYQAARSGQDALNTYQQQWPARYCLFDEDGSWSYDCSSHSYPDFSAFGADIYVAHHNMKWTMVFTHEQPDIGPFFASGTIG